MYTEGNIASTYSKCESLRSPYLQRAREASRLTIPTVLPEEGHKGAHKFPTPYQSTGARGVNNLASALLLS